MLFPLTVVDTSNDTKVGEYHTKQDILAAVDKYKQERKSRAKILVIHYPMRGVWTCSASYLLNLYKFCLKSKDGILICSTGRY